MQSLFITATGTDIGKTYISALLLKKMLNSNNKCGYYKPILSGADGSALNDCEYVIKASGLNIEPSKCVSYCFKEAVSPHLAAKRIGVNIDTKKIFEDYKKLSSNYDYMVIEGAGGVTCPIIEDKYLMWNLIKDLNVPTLIVADGGLGTINSVLTTVEYMLNRNIKINGIALNNYNPNSFMHKDNLEMIEKMTGIKVIAKIEHDETDLNIDSTELKNLFL